MSSPLPVEELRALLRLQLVPGLGPERTHALLEHFGSACRVLHASVNELTEVPNIGPRLANTLVRELPGVDVQGELDRLERHGTSVLVRGRDGYPANLAEIADAPTLLYLRGTVEENDARAVAIVGSRACTEYGRRVARRLGQGLATAGYVVVSGLARGIDGEAHRGALEGGGRTLAVLAGGLASIYPPEHRDLAREVTLHGALFSESSMEQASLPGLFHSRNRIISGLARAVVVVEAAARSGTLITARHAAEQGRSMLAVPGSIESEASAGTHELIRTGAVLCRGLDDILEELNGVSAMYQRAARTVSQKSDTPVTVPPVPIGPPPGLDETQLRVWEFLAGGSRSVDELAQGLSLPVSTLSATLLMLEMKKAVRRLPGNRYERV
jgi:DNA processing protein